MMAIQNINVRLLFVAGLLIAIMALLFSVGCNKQPEEISVELGEEFELKIGQTVSVEDEPIKIKFIEVASDSRCPTGATCVWEGEVTCILGINYLDDTYTTTINQPGLTQHKVMDIFHRYEVAFNVVPYPKLDQEIKADEYRLQLVINKKPSLSGGVLVTFDVEGEEYKIFVQNKETIADVLAVQRGEGQAKIPSGKIIGEPVFYNEPWSWHIDPMDIHMAEFTIEVCSGLPSHVEDDLDYWVNTVGRFCPWSAEIVEIRDFR